MPASCALLDGFAIGARVALLRRHNANAKVSEYMLEHALCLAKLMVIKNLSNPSSLQRDEHHAHYRALYECPVYLLLTYLLTYNKGNLSI